MPIYEYEPDEYDCLICNGRFEAIQGIDEPPLNHCPTCGQLVRRVVSLASFKTRGTLSLDKAGQKGFTAYRRAEKGVWERVAGSGVDAIVGTPEDIAAVEAEKRPPRVVTLEDD
jgi:putative FmdB family regulatory protein